MLARLTETPFLERRAQSLAESWRKGGVQIRREVQTHPDAVIQIERPVQLLPAPRQRIIEKVDELHGSWQDLEYGENPLILQGVEADARVATWLRYINY